MRQQMHDYTLCPRVTSNTWLRLPLSEIIVDKILPTSDVTNTFVSTLHVGQSTSPTSAHHCSCSLATLNSRCKCCQPVVAQPHTAYTAQTSHREFIRKVGTARNHVCCSQQQLLAVGAQQAAAAFASVCTASEGGHLWPANGMHIQWYELLRPMLIRQTALVCQKLAVKLSSF
jgi:hypothetical protein